MTTCCGPSQLPLVGLLYWSPVIGFVYRSLFMYSGLIWYIHVWMCLRYAMVHNLRHPPEDFEVAIRLHYSLRVPDLLALCEAKRIYVALLCSPECLALSSLFSPRARSPCCDQKYHRYRFDLLKRIQKMIYVALLCSPACLALCSLFAPLARSCCSLRGRLSCCSWGILSYTSRGRLLLKIVDYCSR